jgi:hypothetical protein
LCTCLDGKADSISAPDDMRILSYNETRSSRQCLGG